MRIPDVLPSVYLCIFVFGFRVSRKPNTKINVSMFGKTRRMSRSGRIYKQKTDLIKFCRAVGKAKF